MAHFHQAYTPRVEQELSLDQPQGKLLNKENELHCSLSWVWQRYVRRTGDSL